MKSCILILALVFVCHTWARTPYKRDVNCGGGGQTNLCCGCSSCPCPSSTAAPPGNDCQDDECANLPEVNVAMSHSIKVHIGAPVRKKVKTTPKPATQTPGCQNPGGCGNVGYYYPPIYGYQQPYYYQPYPIGCVGGNCGCTGGNCGNCPPGSNCNTNTTPQPETTSSTTPCDQEESTPPPQKCEGDKCGVININFEENHSHNHTISLSCGTGNCGNDGGEPEVNRAVGTSYRSASPVGEVLEESKEDEGTPDDGENQPEQSNEATPDDGENQPEQSNEANQNVEPEAT